MCLVGKTRTLQHYIYELYRCTNSAIYLLFWQLLIKLLWYRFGEQELQFENQKKKRAPVSILRPAISFPGDYPLQFNSERKYPVQIIGCWIIIGRLKKMYRWSM